MSGYKKRAGFFLCSSVRARNRDLLFREEKLYKKGERRYKPDAAGGACFLQTGTARRP